MISPLKEFAEAAHLRSMSAGGSQPYHIAASAAALVPGRGSCCDTMAERLRQQDWLPAVPYFAKLIDDEPAPEAAILAGLPPCNELIVIDRQQLDFPEPGLHLHTPASKYWLPSSCFELDLHFSPN